MMPESPPQGTAHAEVVISDHHETDSIPVNDVIFWVCMVLIVPLFIGAWKLLIGKVINDAKESWKAVKEDIEKLKEDTIKQELELSQRPTFDQMQDKFDRERRREDG